MDTVSYWTGEHGDKPKEFYQSASGKDDGITLIYGYYEHKHNGNKEKAIGIFWNENWPVSYGRLSPCIIPEPEAGIFLRGLLGSLLAEKKYKIAMGVIEALDFLCK